MNPFEFELRKSLRDIVPRWLKELDQHKGDRAELRRAQKAADVYGVAMAHRLVDLLAPGPRHADAVFFVAALLAHVRDPLAPTLGERLEHESQGAKPGEGKLKPQRFAQLLRADDLPDRLRLFRRVLQLVDGSADATDLAHLFLTWSDNATKRDFARRYFSPRTPHDADADPVAAPTNA